MNMQGLGKRLVSCPNYFLPSWWVRKTRSGNETRMKLLSDTSTIIDLSFEGIFNYKLHNFQIITKKTNAKELGMQAIGSS